MAGSLSHFVNAVSKQRETGADAQLSSPFLSVLDPSPWNSATRIQGES